MRMSILVVIAAFGLAGAATAQTTGTNSVPAQIGNRANGKSYQPTPGEVAPREKAVGVQPSEQQERANSQDLNRMDRNLLRSEGLSTKSVPDISKGR